MTDVSAPETSVLNPYDEVPYGGQTVPLAHPERLAIAALKRGLSPAPPDRCRILELGCAEGGNVVPIAFHLDGCEVVGIDGSAVQIERAMEARDRLGLDNLELRHANILELGDELGTFDYILCHGVFSWVPEPVRDKILAISKAHLTPHGVSYISYNCAPGWAFRSLMRRALMQRVRGVTDPEERIRRVRQVIGWMAGSPVKDTPWGQLLAAEAEGVWSHRDAYLVHEYLSEENRAFHFREIVDLAQSHGLAFLSELTRATSDPRLEGAFRESFSEHVEDWVEAEELSETFLFRAFRCSLFVRDDAPLGAPHPELESRVRLAARVESEAPRVSLDAGVHEFFRVSGLRISADDPVLKAGLIELGRWWPRGLSLDEIEERVTALLQVRRVLPPGERPAADKLAALRSDLMRLADFGLVEERLREPPVTAEPPARPRVGALTRWQAERSPWATNAHHRVVPFDAFTRILIRHLDGARDRAELVGRMREHAEAGDVSLTLEDGAPLGSDDLDEALPKLVEAALVGLAVEGLLA
ncbi:MAG: methyltransferase domain-containing protein [Myxococcales bacterium]|nr:methyltransferase domain-containing protein [Myxococcales bacterium]